MLKSVYALVIFVAAAVQVSAQVTNTSYDLPTGERVLRHEVVIDAPRPRVWSAFTTPSEMAGFIAPVIALDLRPGGIWESSYNTGAKLGAPNNILNEVLSYLPERMLSIRIKRTPPGFPGPEEGKSLWTVMSFDELPGGKTRVTVEMLPFRSGGNWDVLHKVFDEGNQITLQRARDYFVRGPHDWTAKSRK